MSVTLLVLIMLLRLLNLEIFILLVKAWKRIFNMLKPYMKKLQPKEIQKL